MIGVGLSRSISSKLIAAMLLAALLPLTLFGVVAYRHQRSALSENSGVDQVEVTRAVTELRTLLIASFVIAGLSALALAYWLSHRLTKPLKRLTATAAHMSGDGHGKRAFVGGADEIGDLARALNKMADRQEATTDELVDKNDQLQQFLYVSSHDLKTPLRAIASYGQLLESDWGEKLDDAGQTYLDQINASATRMYALLDDLLAYVKAGQIEASFEPVSLDGVLRRVRDTHEFELSKAGATLSISHLGMAFGSSLLLEEVFSNLVGNAIKYRRPTVPARIGVTATEQGRRSITVHVEDNGMGIPPEHRERVFQPFQRLHRKDEIGGSGVGLAICERVVAGHRGSITATASHLGGTAIHVTIPRSGDG